MGSRILHRATYGKKTNRIGGMTILFPWSENIQAERTEEMLYAHRLKVLGDATIDDECPHNWGISHHAIQRLFERNASLEAIETTKIHLFIKKALLYVPITSFFTTLLCQIDWIEGTIQDSKIAGPGETEKSFGISIPSPFGMFLAQFDRNVMSIKTFISLDMLNDEQLLARQEQVKKLKPYLESSFVYDHFDGPVEMLSSFGIGVGKNIRALGWLKTLVFRDILESSISNFILTGPNVDQLVQSATKIFPLADETNTYYGQEEHHVRKIISVLREALKDNGWEGGIRAMTPAMNVGLVRLARG